MDKFTEMGSDKTGALLLRYSLPAIAGMLLVSVYSVIDRIFVGQATGSSGLAAVTVAFPVMIIGYAAAMLANAGGSSLIARLLGTGNKADAEKALGLSVLIGAVVAGLSGLLCLPFLDPLLRVFGASDTILPAARQFSLLTLASFPFQGASMGFAAGVRSQGKANTAMLMGLIGIVTNTVLCGLFVMVMGWGVAGSAWATLITQVVSTIIGGGWFIIGRGDLRFKLHNLAWNRELGGNILQVGLSAWLMNIIPVILFIILNNEMVKLAGDVGLAMIGIVNTVAMIAVTPVYGIMQGAAPLMSYNHGQANSRRVQKVFIQSLVASTLILSLFWGLLELFPNAFIQAFSANDQALIELGRRGLAIYMMMFPLIGLPIALTQYYQSIGSALPASILGTSRQIIFLVPALLLLPIWWGVDGVIWSGPVADGLAVILALGFLLFELPRLTRRVASGSQ